MCKRLRLCLRFAVLCSMVPFFGTVSILPTFAADTADERVVSVAGYLSRGESDMLRPVTVITEEDIRLSGMKNIADLLRQTVYNSLGSYREQSGSNLAQNAFVDLRAIGQDLTLILVNGRRIPGSPFSGDSAADLNAIPILAIQRIEILTDSAGAIHGGDAIGGAINIVLKDDYEGAEIQANVGRPTRSGADSEHVNFLWGSEIGRGHLTIGGDLFRREAIRDADRDYSRALFTPGGSFQDTQGVSVGGNTVFLTDHPDHAILSLDSPDSHAHVSAIGECDPKNGYTGVLNDPFGVPGTGCGFAYANISLQTGALDRRNLFLNGDYALDEDTDVYVNARFAQSETLGRFAPAVGYITVPRDAIRDTILPDEFEGQDRLLASHRFVAHGNRDNRVDLKEYDLALGLRGRLPHDIGYDAYVRYYRYDALEEGNTYVQTSAITQAVADGDYNIENPFSTDPRHLEAVQATGLRLTRDLVKDYWATRVLFDGTAFAFRGHDVRWAAGAEYAGENYEDVYDRFRQAQDVLGSAGNSASGNRDRWATFAEVSVPLLPNWDLTFVGRYDGYDDVGSWFSPQAASRFRLNDHLAFRASWSQSAKAPNFNELYALPQTSHPYVIDRVACPSTIDQTNPACSPRQVRTEFAGNPNLEPGDSESFNIGAVANLKMISLSVDYFRITLTDMPSYIPANVIVNMEAMGTLPDALAVERLNDEPDSLITLIRSSVVNGLSRDIEGLDWRAGLDWKNDVANLAFNARWSWLTHYAWQLAGETGPQGTYPRHRVNTSLRLNRDDFTFNWAAHVISSFETALPDSHEYENWFTHDLTLDWQNAMGFKGLGMTGGILNVGNRVGPLVNLYPVEGRLFFLSAAIAFGS